MWPFGNNRADDSTAPFPEGWKHLLSSKIPLYSKLSSENRQILEKYIRQFLQTKNYEGCAGFEISDEVRVLIAAWASLLLIGRMTACYPTVNTILVYPTAFIATDGLLHKQTQSDRPAILAGQAWQKDLVILSWQDVVAGIEHSHDGYNVIIHEFAHHCDLEDGAFDGVPNLASVELQSRFKRAIEKGYETLRAKIQNDQNRFLRDYAAESPAEYFAVASEYFFERPFELRNNHQHLYEALVDYYRWDPGNPGQARQPPVRPNPNSQPYRDTTDARLVDLSRQASRSLLLVALLTAVGLIVFIHFGLQSTQAVAIAGVVIAVVNLLTWFGPAVVKRLFKKERGN